MLVCLVHACINVEYNFLPVVQLTEIMRVFNEIHCPFQLIVGGPDLVLIASAIRKQPIRRLCSADRIHHAKLLSKQENFRFHKSRDRTEINSAIAVFSKKAN